ncbi:hypothetical protein FVEN_g917 [Fusarium venenatum]|uniref:Uncharacterized protein n=1 Tax=Fusarium venenatum TaxID=56646 RepID=A0A2L2TPV4_9HYPO|nr:uncharacterized protein FVRRES_10670 [Fusarium venenatum]KAG8361543.1 hypothetical protein FVEN_g917 [Fusarium venenatum]KAH6967258.1 hypothetical protein EDB82DRAFT_530938 [Fusarium venenatum]CEI70593.1 unnamed protein product [Fusarium venenatum]
MHGQPALPIILINGYPDVPTSVVANKLDDQITIWDVKRLLGLGYREDGVPVAQSKDSFNTCYVFTDFIVDDLNGQITMEKYSEMAKNRGCPLIVINLVCHPGERRGRTPMWRGPNGLFWTELNVSTESANSMATKIAGHATLEAFSFWHCS